MLGRGVAIAYAEHDDWEQAFAWLQPTFQRADLVAANLESPLAYPHAKIIPQGYDLRAPLDGLKAISSSGFDILSIANNHIQDEGMEGAFYTEKKLKESGLLSVGLSQQPLLIEKDGLRLAFLAWDDAKQNPFSVIVKHPLDIQQAAQVVSKARLKGYWVIVSMHWGSEYCLGTSARQREIAQAFADAGATLIWGHHPHVLQPITWLQGKGQSKPTLVAYSLGNALFDQMTPPGAKMSVVLEVELSRDGIREMNSIPFEIQAHKGRVGAPKPETVEKVYHDIYVEKR